MPGLPGESQDNRHMSNVKRLVVLIVFALGLWITTSSAQQQEYEFQAGRWVAGAPPAKGTPEGDLLLIRQQMDRSRYLGAVSAAKRFLKRYGDDPACEEVMLMAGEAELKRGRLFQAYEWFEKQLAEFPAGRFSDRALDREFVAAEGFLAGKKRIALGIFRLPARDDGLEILSRIAEHVPGTALAERALMRIADDHYSRNEYAEAAESYDAYLTAFPNGSMAVDAMLKAANATYWSFNGIAYDETPLIEAEQRYRAFAQRHPISAKEAGVDETLEAIRLTRAEKVLAEAKFYERLDRPGAAAFSYRYVVENYPRTGAADQAAESLTRLGGQPAPTAGPVEAPPVAPSEAAEAEEVRQPAAEAAPDQTVDLEKLLPETAPKGDTK